MSTTILYRNLPASHFSAMKIHISVYCYQALEKVTGYLMEERGEMEIKVRWEQMAGCLQTTFLNG